MAQLELDVAENVQRAHALFRRCKVAEQLDGTGGVHERLAELPAPRADEVGFLEFELGPDGRAQVAPVVKDALCIGCALRCQLVLVVVGGRRGQVQQHLGDVDVVAAIQRLRQCHTLAMQCDHFGPQIQVVVHAGQCVGHA